MVFTGPGLVQARQTSSVMGDLSATGVRSVSSEGGWLEDNHEILPERGEISIASIGLVHAMKRSTKR